MSNDIRFIIITVPPPEIAGEIREIQKPLCLLSHSFAALRYPPHISLSKGAVVPEEMISSYINGLKSVLKDEQPFTISTWGYSFTAYRSDQDTKYILYYKIKKTKELIHLHNTLAKYNPYMKKKSKYYKPHLGLVFDDLTRLQYHLLQKEVKYTNILKDKEFTWVCDNVCLYTLEGRKWMPVFEYKFTRRYAAAHF
jgi:2'-5' RNA ligase